MAERDGTVWIEVRGDTDPFLRDVGSAAERAGRSFGGFGRGSAALTGVALAAGGAATGVAYLGTEAVRASSQFNSAMSSVQAVSNATAGELTSLRDAAVQAGSDTVFTATEAAQAQAELARAGVSVADVLGGALAGSLDLAAAGQIGLEQASVTTAQALNTFNLEGDQATRVADVLAAGANKSAADVSSLSQALSQGGLVAKQTGLSLEDTVGVLSLFADNALVGSDAGTSLKTMLQRLVPQSDEAAGAMEQLGLSFFDAQGNFVGIEQVAGQLQTSLRGLSTEQRQTALTTIFGADAIRAAGILYDAGATGVNDYTKAVNDQGAAQRVAAQLLDNLAGDVEKFGGSVDASLVGLGSKSDEGLRRIVQTGTELVNDLAESPAFDALGDRAGEALNRVADGVETVADEVSAFLADLSRSDVDEFFTNLADTVDGVAGPLAGLGTSLASIGASRLPFLSTLVPGIGPVQAALTGLVLQSEAGRDALGSMFEIGTDAAEAAEPVLRLAADTVGYLADQSWLVVPAMSAFAAVKINDTVGGWVNSFRSFRGTMGLTLAELEAKGAALRAQKVLGSIAEEAVSAGPPFDSFRIVVTQATDSLLDLGPAAALGAAGVSKLTAISNTGQLERLAIDAGVATDAMLALGPAAAGPGTGFVIVGDAAAGAAIPLAQFTESTLAANAAMAPTPVLAAQSAAGIAGLATAMGAMAREQLALSAAPAAGRGDFIDVESWEVFDGVSERAALGAGKIAGAADAAGGSVINLGSRLGNVARGGVASLSTALDGLLSQFGGPLGLTAVISGGLYLYGQWADEQRAVESATDDLTEALLRQGEVQAGQQLAQQFSGILADNEDATAAFAKSGLAVSQVTSLINDDAAAFSEGLGFFRLAFDDVKGGAEEFARTSESIPESARPFVALLGEMADKGTLTEGEMRSLVDAMQELALASTSTRDSLGIQAQRFKEEADGANLSAEAQRQLAIAMDKTSSLQQVRDAIDYLRDAYPDLAAAAGIAGSAITEAGDAADGAADDYRPLGGLFDDLAGGANNLTGAMLDNAGAAKIMSDAARESIGDVVGLLDAQDGYQDALRSEQEARKKLADIEAGISPGLISARQDLIDAESDFAKAIQDNADAIEDAEQRLAEAEDRLEAAREKGAAIGSGGAAGVIQVKPDLSVARDIRDAERGVADARRELDRLQAGDSDNLASARGRVADAQARVNEETAKLGPNSDAARDAQAELDDAQRRVASSALAVSDAMGKVTADDIPAAVDGLVTLGGQFGEAKTSVDELIGSILVLGATIPTIPSLPPIVTEPAAKPKYQPDDRRGGVSQGTTNSGTVWNPFEGWKVGPGRARGGDVWPGTMFPVNELDEPEMYTDRSGQSYLLPADPGTVTPLTPGTLGTGQKGMPAYLHGDGREHAVMPGGEREHAVMPTEAISTLVAEQRRTADETRRSNLEAADTIVAALMRFIEGNLRPNHVVQHNYGVTYGESPVDQARRAADGAYR